MDFSKQFDDIFKTPDSIWRDKHSTKLCSQIELPKVAIHLSNAFSRLKIRIIVKYCNFCKHCKLLLENFVEEFMLMTN